MRYDLLHLPGVTPPGCGVVWISPPLGDDHQPGDRIAGLTCERCGRCGEHEVRGRLEGLA